MNKSKYVSSSPNEHNLMCWSQWTGPYSIFWPQILSSPLLLVPLVPIDQHPNTNPNELELNWSKQNGLNKLVQTCRSKISLQIRLNVPVFKEYCPIQA